MTTEELKERGAIYFDKITTGFREYADVTLKMDAKKALSHFKSLRKEYGAENSYADFYYFRLDEDAREMVNELLSEEEISWLALISPMPDEVEDEIIFPLNDRLLRIIVRLNAEEMLFSTIYFVQPDENGRPRTTWWGNYEKEYICFRDRQQGEA
ncbi:MAG: hypothetical protein LIO56_03865 [Lachnospiraceae bacterium]|nr:hypothetical protein [Lachnospiraceae bacterium]